MQIFQPSIQSMKCGILAFFVTLFIGFVPISFSGNTTSANFAEAQTAFTCPSGFSTGPTSNGVTQCTINGSNADSINYDDSTGQPVTTGTGGVQGSTGAQV